MLGVEVDGKWGKKSRQALDEWRFWNEGSVVDVDDADVEVPDTSDKGAAMTGAGERSQTTGPAQKNAKAGSGTDAYIF